MKKFGNILLLVSVFCLYLTVGAMEQNVMPFAEGCIKSAIFLTTMLAGAIITKKYEEKRK